mmetsp:Transcript_70772/g.187731  ORF Transcript_70772/g.187731 Transcript_70772/m.187731 type:complete len:260 (+) Transcript_70772:364-1143(+)
MPGRSGSSSTLAYTCDRRWRSQRRLRSVQSSNPKSLNSVVPSPTSHTSEISAISSGGSFFSASSPSFGGATNLVPLLALSLSSATRFSKSAEVVLNHSFGARSSTRAETLSFRTKLFRYCLASVSSAHSNLISSKPSLLSGIEKPANDWERTAPLRSLVTTGLKQVVFSSSVSSATGGSSATSSSSSSLTSSLASSLTSSFASSFFSSSSFFPAEEPSSFLTSSPASSMTCFFFSSSAFLATSAAAFCFFLRSLSNFFV